MLKSALEKAELESLIKSYFDQEVSADNPYPQFMRTVILTGYPLEIEGRRFNNIEDDLDL